MKKQLTGEDIFCIIYPIWVILSKAFAIALAVLGAHFMHSHIEQSLPFYIPNASDAVWGIWAYTGWFISLLMIAGGIYLLFKEEIDSWIKKKAREHSK